MKKKKEERDDTKRKCAPRFHMEAESGIFGMSVQIIAVRHIEEYCREKITLKIPGGRMDLLGQGLYLTVFENKTVEVRGKLSEVCFSYDRN